jgi:hypothetical protein
MLRRKWAITGWVCLCALSMAGFCGFACPAARAQVAAGISVQVKDAADAVIADAEVTLLGAGGQSVAGEQCDAEGRVALLGIAPGKYSLRVVAAGFDTATVDVVVEGRNATAVTVVLLTSDASHAAMLERIDSSVSGAGILSSAELPVESRDQLGFAELLPTANIVPDVGRDPEQDVQERVSFRGLSQTTNSSQLDGMSNNQAFTGVARGEPHTAAGFSSEAVQDFAVNAADYSARFGGVPGAVVNAVSRRGESFAGLNSAARLGMKAGRGAAFSHEAKAIHGTTFLFLRDNIFDAANPYSLASTYNSTTGKVMTSEVRPEDVRVRWGGTAGGTLYGGKADWFLAYDQQYRDFPMVSAPSSPTFLSLTTSQIDVLAGRGVTSSQVSSALEYLAGKTGVSPRTSNQVNFFPRVDWQLGERDRFTAEYSGLRMNGPATGMTSPVVARATDSIGSSTLGVEEVPLHWVHFLTENIGNEFAVQYAHELGEEYAPGNASPMPQVSMGVGGMVLGTPSFLPKAAYPDERTAEMTDTVTWVHGKHTVTAGAEWTRTEERIDWLRYSNGAYSYNNIVDWISDYTYNNYTYNHGGAVDGVCIVPKGAGVELHYECFDRYTQAFGAQTLGFHTTDWAAFVEENWKLGRRLTVNAGLRYEYEQLPAPQLPNPALDAAFAGIGSTSVYPEDKNNFGPRVGLAWDPFGKGRGVVRVGYGVYFGRVLNSTLEAVLQNSGITTAQNTGALECNGSTGEQCRVSLNASTTTTLGGYANTFANYAATAGIAPSQYTRSVLMGDRFRVPMIQQGELNVEREFPRLATVSLTYMASVSRQLPNMVDANIAAAPSTGTFFLEGAAPNAQLGAYNGETFAVPEYQVRANPNYGPVSEIVSNINGYYNAVMMEATRRLQHGVAIDARWTWSKAIDFGQTAGGLGTSASAINDNQFDPYQVRYDRGLSDFNLPHKVAVAMIAEPRWHVRGKRLRSGVNGWEWIPLVTEQSGFPYSYNIYGGTSLSGGHDSINRSGGAQYLPTVGRNTLRLPDTYNFNLRLSRNFVLRNHLRVEAMVESYNLLNHQNHAGLVTTAYAALPVDQSVIPGETELQFQDATQSSTPFGQYIASATGRYAERQMQFAVRLHF